MQITQKMLIGVALIFGLLTMFEGSRVLLGSDPGYIVFRPLLMYNAAMGIVYVAAGVFAWRNLKKGMYMAASIFALNLLVLMMIFFLYAEGESIAVDSLRAMSLRTVVWLVLSVGFWRLSKNNKMNASKEGA